MLGKYSIVENSLLPPYLPAVAGQTSVGRQVSFKVSNPARAKCKFNAKYAVFHVFLSYQRIPAIENMHHLRSGLALAVTALFWLRSPFGNKPFCSGSFWRRVRQTHPKKWPEKNGK